jgi:hypothetical protein
VAVVVLQQSGPSSRGDIAQSSLAWLPGPARSAPASRREPTTPATKPARLAALAPGEARTARLGRGEALASTHTEHLRSGGLANPIARNAPARRDADPHEDWLGAQLRLLREAREQLEAGRLEQAERVLNSYAPRFPGGVLGPQVNGLREELSERRTTARSVSGRALPLR